MSITPDPSTVSVEIDDLLAANAGSDSTRASPLPYNPTQETPPSRPQMPPRVETPSLQEFAGANSSYEPLPEDFFRTIFYFSGMGRVIGSALNEGVHVDERQREKAIDPEQLPPHLREQLHRDEYPLVISCRNQAHNIYNGLKNLHSLLDQVPSYTDSAQPVTYRPSSTQPADVNVDDPIHASKYFRVNRMRDSLGDIRDT